MSDLEAHLAARIRAGGPLRVSEFMAEALLNPTHGYYTTRDPLGAAGDFTTAPEISQMFGEMIGLCLAQSWLDQGHPARFALAELGPGRGTLMADILRATRAVPGFTEAATLHLVEASPPLRAAQRATLGEEVTWHDSIDTLPEDRALFLVANEFFDALPIRQFLRSGPGWRERLVGLEDESLRFGLGDLLAQPALHHRLADTQEGDLVEICPQAAPIMAAIGTRIEAQGGVGIVIDYGDWRSLGDTLQAMRAHEKVAPLEAPGTADLTAHVDFEALANATPSAHSRLTPQGVFLERLGITARAQALAKGLSGAALESHIAAHRRLTHPEEMGNLFKTLAVYPTDATPPPGFEA
ncbi:class I SAM-dependent methyltransferase [Shimia sp. FJ5]|uniref:class I SAM-dependent methyltransferase n=1 Tax=Shimia sp. FJ5 TaxID=3079054 RepID=UPI00262F9994|nr:SAM-dependent methyltransferase [Shimia sp. FJ5]MDV4145927.1 SAM-dependent methyltransferase [Shimia sp. FJ5]